VPVFIQSRGMKKTLLFIFLCSASYLLNAQDIDSVKRKQAPASSRLVLNRNATIKSNKKIQGEITTKEQVKKDIDAILQSLAGMPDNSSTWALAKNKITDYLLVKHKTGKLMGTTPAEAFYVTVDQTTMTQADINSGKLIVEVGLALIKPAEFESLRFIKQL
jgi:phage tail sheath protein FI